MLFQLTVEHRPNRDGSVPLTRHVPFYLALETAADAWQRALAVTCDGVLAPSDLAVVNATADFTHEMFTGPADFEVRLAHIGVSSLQFTVAIEQRHRAVGTFATTLVRVDGTRQHALALSSGQRAALEAFQTLSLGGG